MSSEFLFQTQSPKLPQSPSTWLKFGDQTVPVFFIRKRAARHFILRVRPDKSVRVTLPLRASLDDALSFFKKHLQWVAEQIKKQSCHPSLALPWQDGTEILFRGEKTVLRVKSNPAGPLIELADQTIPLPSPQTDLRAAVEQYLRSLASVELPTRTLQLAAQHSAPVRKITVRNQRSRWGSCSVGGTISLNWRLIQTPPFVRDYIILHELMHLRQMNHSPLYWAHVRNVCPDFHLAERWLSQNSKSLR